MRIGIAGYMGAGKSTCARLFEGTDAVIIDADAEAKVLMSRDRRLRSGLRGAFGGAVIDDGGRPRFDVLGGAVFESVDTLLAFNKIVHPPVVRHLEGLVVNCDRPVCILDAALIPLWKEAETWFDLRAWIDVPFDARLERLKAKRADIDEGELARRMRMQEEVMPVPAGNGWVRLPDSECYEYIRDKIAANKPR